MFYRPRTAVLFDSDAARNNLKILVERFIVKSCFQPV
jgi:hypothetical protein